MGLMNIFSMSVFTFLLDAGLFLVSVALKNIKCGCALPKSQCLLGLFHNIFGFLEGDFHRKIVRKSEEEVIIIKVQQKIIISTAKIIIILIKSTAESNNKNFLSQGRLLRCERKSNGF